MLNCDEALELISARVDGALTREEDLRLERHLEQCPACRALLEDFQAMEELFPTLAPQAPAGLAEDVMARVRASKVTPFQGKRRQWRWRSLASLAAVLVLVVVGGNALRQWQGAAGGGASGGAAAPAAADAGEQILTRDLPAGSEENAQEAGGTEEASAPEEPAAPKNAGPETGETFQQAGGGSAPASDSSETGREPAAPEQSQLPQAETVGPQVLTISPAQGEGTASAEGLTGEEALLELAAWLGWDTEALTVDEAGVLAGPTAEDGTVSALVCAGMNGEGTGWVCQLTRTAPGPDGAASCTAYTVLLDGTVLPPDP